jgi:phosphatidylglycerophosphate synthase
MLNPISQASSKLNPIVDPAAIDAGRLAGSVFVTGDAKDLWVNGIFRPIENFCVRRGFTPNQITWTGLFITLVASVFLAMGHFLIGGWLIILGGCCDFLDGRIARRLNLQTQSGAFFDSVLDRYMDAASLFALAYFFRNSWIDLIVYLALLGSVTTPYIRAKAESLGLKSDGGQMQRPERIAFIGVGSLFLFGVVLLK